MGAVNVCLFSRTLNHRHGRQEVTVPGEGWAGWEGVQRSAGNREVCVHMPVGKEGIVGRKESAAWGRHTKIEEQAEQ